MLYSSWAWQKATVCRLCCDIDVQCDDNNKRRIIHDVERTMQQ